MKRSYMLLALLIALCFGLAGSGNVAAAQGTERLAQLDGRASPGLKAQVGAVADSVARAGLPVAPLVDKTLEGISKGADDRRIMIAVHTVAAQLGVARRALGPVSDAELTAAVAALRAGSSADGLTELRHALPGRPLLVPLSVLASLMVDGAPPSSAIVAVSSSAKQHSDSDVLAYGRDVSRNIASGVAPLTAMSAALTSIDAASSFRPASIPKTPHSSPKPKP